MKADAAPPHDILETLLGSRSFARVLFEGSPAGILVVDRDCTILGLNPRMQAWLQKPAAEVIGRVCHTEVFRSADPCPLASHGCPGRHALETGEPSPPVVRSCQTEENRRRDLEIRAYPIVDDSGTPRVALAFLHDVTDAMLLKSFREEAPLRDPLTGLYNRKAFHKHLERELNRAQRQSHPFSLALVDCDSFKDYNDHRGNEAGDELLQQLGNLLVSTTRKEVDTVFRLEGDRFALTLPEAHREQARHIGERIRQAERQKGFPLTFSLAICEAQESEDPSALLYRVEEELFRAKKSDGTRIV